MRIRMKSDVSGTRNGKDWPHRGEVADFPEDEALELIGAGMAEKVSGKAAADDVETADAPADAETRRAPIKATARVGRVRAPRKAAKATPAAAPDEPPTE